jgi:tetratricopeptide (TPR) repeat protein
LYFFHHKELIHLSVKNSMAIRKIISIVFLLLPAALPCRAQNNVQKANPTNIKKADSLFQSGEWKYAKTLYELEATKSPLTASGWSRLGFSNYQLGLYEEAMPAFREVIKLNPAPPFKGLTYSRMAKIFALRNDRQNTLVSLDSALNNGYANFAELDTLRDFSNFQTDTAFLSRKQKAYAVTYPCMVDPHLREFDFWVGEWDVFVRGTNTRAGSSKVQVISNGCALLENWEAPPGNGKSINYIDPTNHKWKQAWAGSNTNGTQEFVNGEYKDGAMRFSFESINPQGQKIMGRFIFYNEKPGQVRQFNEISSDGGKTWVTSYDFTYIKK